MRTIFTLGFRPAASFMGPGRPVYAMGQFEWGSLITSLITTGAKVGLEYYTAEKQIREAKKVREAAEAQAAAARQAAAVEQKKTEEILHPPVTAAAGTTAGDTILGIDKTAFYIGAGVLSVGAIVVTLIATR